MSKIHVQPKLERLSGPKSKFYEKIIKYLLFSIIYLFDQFITCI